MTSQEARVLMEAALAAANRQIDDAWRQGGPEGHRLYTAYLGSRQVLIARWEAEIERLLARLATSVNLDVSKVRAVRMPPINEFVYRPGKGWEAVDG